MGEAGSPYARLRRALATGNALLAWTAAAEVDRVPLEDALLLVLLVVDEPRYPGAAVRWLGRLCLEQPPGLGQVQLIACALAGLPDADAGAALAAACSRMRMGRAVRALEEMTSARAAVLGAGP
jgi:hypothetical protein